MRKAAVVMMLVAIGACSRGSATKYVAPGGEFRIGLPATPTVEERGSEKVYKLASGDTAYLIRQMPWPVDFSADATPERLFDEYQRNGLAALQGALQGERSVVAAGLAVPGREFVVHAETKKSGRPYEMTTRLFRVGGQLFVFTATTPREESVRAKATTVLDSLAFGG